VCGETIRNRTVNALEIAATFEKVGIKQVRVEGVLLDMLPVSAGFPGMLADIRTVDHAQAVAAAECHANLVGLGISGLGGGNSDKTRVRKYWSILGAKCGPGAL